MPQTLQTGQITYSGTGGFWNLHHFMWDSRYIGQVKEGLIGESIIFEMPQIITPVASSDTSDSCADRTKVCLDKETTTLTIDHFTSVAHKVDKCDIAKAGQIASDLDYTNYASEIEFQYTKQEDTEWLADIDGKLPTTTLDIGGTTTFGSTITSANSLLIHMISEVAKMNDVGQENLAVGVSQEFYTEIKSLYGSGCYLGSEGPQVELGSNELGVMSFYRIPESMRPANTHVMIYPWAAAIKGVACKLAAWSDGTGSEANKSFYNRDADYLVDFKKLRESDAEYVGLKYAIVA